MKRISLLFIAMALLALLVGAMFGVLAGIQYIFPEFLKETIAFNKMRPFHVSTVVGWIILCATGGIYYYLQEVLNTTLYSSKLLKTHFIIFVVCAIAVYISFATGKMGGREYMEYFPLITLPILIGWILFGINYFKTTLKQIQNWPVYLWMWGTGIVFMTYHFTEAHFWLIPYFRENFIKDFAVQWKSYGSFVGSWNMLVYGTSVFLMAKVKGNESVACGKKAFFFYFLGLFNLMLGWAHHSYIVPTVPWIRYLAYGVSMTEWIIFFSILRDWKKMLSADEKIKNNLSYQFLVSTEFWVCINLFIALLISIPYINYYTHGTHITVLHSMGTTIGINTSILLASVIFIVNRAMPQVTEQFKKQILSGFWILNISLLVFLCSLLWSGIKRSIWMYFSENPVPFGSMQEDLQSVMYVFLLSGLGILTGLLFIAFPLLKRGILPLTKK
ncbi:MAG: cbb3-type cytochrome c oxidase subunit I [Flavobacteriales bacterium]|nr:cbb3-type cytochrome c oxidase subunit I [Flavobacteriales bacterium]